ncbi:hypothetical protein [Ruminococcus sp.]|uniref:hypothetical protein n=1 Tax=Ruminococcus sp. TaxID=41978 RepID=UPI0025EC3C75|nr:hypothetical protein [Ruminococcus sp.]
MHVKFNRDMASDIQPMVTYGGSEPYTDFAVSGDWANAREWVSEFKIDPYIDLGTMYIRVKGAAAADDKWLVTGTDWGRFKFEITNSSAQSMSLTGEGQLGKNALNWMQDDYDTLAGYNIYRSTNYDPSAKPETQSFQRVNKSVLNADELSFIDENVQPGTNYYYYFTVVDTDLNESKASNVVSCCPAEGEPPVINHTPVTALEPDKAISITADITDNVKVAGAALYYKSKSDDSWKSVDMRNTTGSTYKATIAAYEVSDEELYYYITATDGANAGFCGTADKPNVIAPHYNKVIDKAVPATCTSSGKTEGSHCAVCGKILKAQTEIPATGHKYGDFVVTKQPTCTANGTKTKTCKSCGDKITEAIPAKGHTIVIDNAVAATCTTAGRTEGSHCSVCGAITQEQVAIKATGHKSSAWITDKAATIGVKGKKHKECTVCKTVLETADIPAITVTKQSVSKASVTLSTSTYAYDGKAKQPSVTVKLNGKTLKKGTDYTVSYSNNTKVGTATVKITAKGNYTGTISKTFKIKNNFAKSTVSGIATKTYTGKAQTQKITVKFNGKTLKSGTDYTLTYTNNTKVGTATVKITAKGNYTGTITRTFKINPPKTNISRVTAKSKALVIN